MGNLILNEPVTENEIKQALELDTRLYKHKEIADLISPFFILVFCVSLIFMLVNELRLISVGNGFVNDYSILAPCLVVGFLAAVITRGYSVCVIDRIRFEKDELNPLTDYGINEMLKYCAQFPEVELYRKKVIAQGRFMYRFELNAARRIERDLISARHFEEREKKYDENRRKLYSNQDQ